MTSRRRSSRLTGAPIEEVQSLDTVLTENRKRSRRCSNTSVTSDLDNNEKVSDSTPMDAMVKEPAMKRTRKCSSTSAASDVDSKKKVSDSFPVDAVVKEPTRKRTRKGSSTSATSDLDSNEKVTDSTPIEPVVKEPARKRTRKCSSTSVTSDLDGKKKVSDSTSMDAVVEEPAEDIKKDPSNVEDENDTKENDVECKNVGDIKKETNEKITMDLNRYEKELKIKARCKSGRFWKSERDRFRSVIRYVIHLFFISNNISKSIFNFRSNKGLKSKQMKNYKNERENRTRIKAYEQSLKGIDYLYTVY